MNQPNFITDHKSKVFPIIGIILIIFFIFIAVLSFARIYLGKPLVEESGNVGIVELNGVILDSKEIIEQLEDFRKDNDIKAIIVRVDSPGGSVGPSQEIYEEIQRVKKTKKVIASLGNIAASGGYYAIAAADRIVANPSTITGSIGVIAEFMNVKNLVEWAKLKPITLKSGKYKDMGSGFRDMTEEEKALMTGLLKDIHNQFIEAVSSGRGLDKTKVASIADGRVFTGREAKERGLVDELGGLEFSKDVAQKLAGIKEEVKAMYPKKPGMQFLNMLLDEKAEGKLQNFLQSSSWAKYKLLLSPVLSSLFVSERTLDIK